MQLESTVKYLFTPTRLAKIKKIDNNSIGEDVEKLEPSQTVGGNVKWCSHFEKQSGNFSKQSGNFSKKLNIELLYDPAIPLFGKYSKELKTYIHTEIYM